MKTKILLLLMIAAGVVVISKPPAASGAGRASMQQFCVTITGNIPRTCGCPGGGLGTLEVFARPASGCGTKIKSTVLPFCDAAQPCQDTNDIVSDCSVAQCNAVHDGDGDGFGKQCCGGADCNDNNASIKPGATEVCDQVDNNCDGQTDEGRGEECSGSCGTGCPGSTCYCELAGSQCAHHTPILIDIAGDGISLTSAPGGVEFDPSGLETKRRFAWTAARSDDAWLALDRNGNAVIDDGRELFGNYTPQPDPEPGKERNGFLALAEFDKAAKGGNVDGQIDSKDSVFSSLRLWQDSNHNGISEAGELHTLSDLGVAVLELDYKESKRTDEHGNNFRWRAKVKDVHGAQVGRWAWDVIPVLVKQ
jgi:Putative metal-binding motif